MDKPKKRIKAEQEIKELGRILSESYSGFIGCLPSEPNKDAIRKANPVMSKSVVKRLKVQTGEDFTKPIIDIYLPYDTVREMAIDFNNQELSQFTKTWEEVLRDAAANHTAKQIIDWLDNNVLDAKNSYYPNKVVWAITGEQLEALKNLVKEK
jgi:hypothetical protein